MANLKSIPVNATVTAKTVLLITDTDTADGTTVTVISRAVNLAVIRATAEEIKIT